MKKKNSMEEDNLPLQVEPIELSDPIPYQRNYELMGQLILIADKLNDDKDFPLSVYYIEIIALINKQYKQSHGKLYKKIPFGVFFDRAKVKQLVFSKKKAHSKFINMLSQKLNKQVKTIQKRKAKNKYYYSLIDTKDQKEVLESQYVEDSIKDNKDVILLKLDSGFVKILLTEDTYEDYEERKYDLLTRYFLKPEKFRKNSDIHRYLQYIYNLVKLSSPYKVISKEKYFGYLEDIFDFVKMWKKMLIVYNKSRELRNSSTNIELGEKGQVENWNEILGSIERLDEEKDDKFEADEKAEERKIVFRKINDSKVQKFLRVPPTKIRKVSSLFLSPLRDFMAEHKYVRKRWEREKAYKEREKKVYEPLKYFYCSFFDALIEEVESLTLIKYCDYCGNIFRDSKKKKYCTKGDGKIGGKIMDCAKSVRNKKRYKYQKDKKKLIEIIIHPQNGNSSTRKSKKK